MICEPEISLNAINLNARCFAIPQHGRKKNTEATATQLVPLNSSRKTTQLLY